MVIKMPNFEGGNLKRVRPSNFSNKIVFVGLSGGIDSAVSAGILSMNYYTVGVFLKLFKNHSFEPAEKVARKLGIPFLVMDFQKEFKKNVIDYFLEEFSEGKTPNPCVMCNKKIKFNLFLKKSLEMGADFIATGHYVRKLQISNSGFSVFKLYRAKDKEKDQSYFLWTLTQARLKKVLFPLGNYTKKQVYELAGKWGLPCGEESVDICFLKGDHREFLKRHLKLKPGVITHISGRIIGRHNGLPLYTIGQRKEIGVSGGPFYVVGFDFKNNTLIVTDDFYDKNLYKKELIAKNVNWISKKKLEFPLKCSAKIRYQHKAESAEIVKSKNRYRVIFKKAQRAVTPGQSVVFYKNNELLGGGIIEK